MDRRQERLELSSGYLLFEFDFFGHIWCSGFLLRFIINLAISSLLFELLLFFLFILLIRSQNVLLVVMRILLRIKLILIVALNIDEFQRNAIKCYPEEKDHYAEDKSP